MWTWFNQRDHRDPNLCPSVSCATALLQNQLEEWWRVAACSAGQGQQLPWAGTCQHHRACQVQLQQGQEYLSSAPSSGVSICSKSVTSGELLLRDTVNRPRDFSTLRPKFWLFCRGWVSGSFFGLVMEWGLRLKSTCHFWMSSWVDWGNGYPELKAGEGHVIETKKFSDLIKVFEVSCSIIFSEISSENSANGAKKDLCLGMCKKSKTFKVIKNMTSFWLCNRVCVVLSTMYLFCHGHVLEGASQHYGR